MKPKYGSRSSLFLPFIAVAVCAGASSLHGQATRTWTGDVDASLATAGNWNVVEPQTAPASGDSWVFGAPGTAGATLTNNLANSTAFEVAGITFGSTATDYSISGGTFTLTGNITNTGGAGNQTIGSNIQVSGSRILQLNGGGTAAGNVTLSGNLTGSGSLTQQAGNGGARSFTFSGDNSGFTGSFTQTNDGSNRTAFSSAASGSASAAWTFNRAVAGGVALNFIDDPEPLNFIPIDFGSLSGGGFIRANNAGTVTVRVGALNTDTTFSGIFQESGGSQFLAVTKTGTGMLTLSGTSSYRGATTVDGGTLNLTGFINNSPVTVNSGGIFQTGGQDKTLNALTVNSGGNAKLAGVSAVANSMTLTGAGAVAGMLDGQTKTLSVNSLNVSQGAALQMEVGSFGSDQINVTGGSFTVGENGATITITNLGLLPGEVYPLINFLDGNGEGFATGTGTTVGALTLANPNLSFGISGELEVTEFGVSLITSGASAPDEAYWSGSQGAEWTSTSGSNANFTTTAAGGTFLNVLPASNTHVFFSNNSPTNLTNSLGANFNIAGLTYRAGSGAVTTTGTETLLLDGGGITVEDGNGGATLAMASLVLPNSQVWTNDSENPLVVSAASVSGPNAILWLEGEGGVHLGGTSFSVNAMTVDSPLDVKGTAVTTNLADSSADITNTGATNTTLTAANFADATISGTISDSYDSGDESGARLAFAKTGTARVTLDAANSYSGGTSISQGTLSAGHNNAFGTGSVGLTGATAVLDLNGSVIGNPLTNSGTGATITNSSESEAVVSLGFNSAGTGGVVISDLTVSGIGDIRWDGAIRRTNGTGTLVKSGTNTLTLNNANSTELIGGMHLRVENGTVVLGKTSTSFTNLTINGGTLKMDSNYEVTTAGFIWQGVFGNEVFMDGGVWDLNDTGANSVTNRVKRVSGSGGVITNSGTGVGRLILAARDASSPAWAGNIQDGENGGRVALTIQWGGSVNQVMTFSGSHTYSGATTLSENVMRAGATGVFSSASDFVLTNNNVGATLDLNDFDNAIGSLASDDTDARVLLGSATLTTGGTDATSTFAGVISGTGGIEKTGEGIFTLSGPNTYTGDTVVHSGWLGVTGSSIADSGRLVVMPGANVLLEGNETVGSLFFGETEQAAGTWGSPESDADHKSDVFIGDGILTVLPAGGYSAWASANAGGGEPDEDFDGDGVANGIEFFMNAPAGFTANPSVVTAGGIRTVTWPNGGNIPASAYGTQFFVQISDDLVGWDLVELGEDSPVSNTEDGVVFTLPDGEDKIFVRLVVNPD